MLFLMKVFSSALAFTSQTYEEVMAIHPDVSYTPYPKYLKEKTDDIITSTHFE